MASIVHTIVEIDSIDAFVGSRGAIHVLHMLSLVSRDFLLLVSYCLVHRLASRD